MFKLYRAVSRQSYQPGKVFTRPGTPRPPSNVPYVVDNIWEFLRPEGLPSRRYAVYASPTPELALANASSVGSDPSAYVVLELQFSGPYKVAHLDVSDARYHADVRAVREAVLAVLGKDFSSLSLEQRTQVSPLFLPCLSREDLKAVAAAEPLVQTCLDSASQVSTFWASAKAEPQAQSNGELFFELLTDQSSYWLTPLTSSE